MSKFTESAIEDFAVKLFEQLGYSYRQAEKAKWTQVEALAGSEKTHRRKARPWRNGGRITTTN
jgi:hypothetical protein